MSKSKKGLRFTGYGIKTGFVSNLTVSSPYMPNLRLWKTPRRLSMRYMSGRLFPGML